MALKTQNLGLFRETPTETSANGGGQKLVNFPSTMAFPLLKFLVPTHGTKSVRIYGTSSSGKSTDPRAEP